MIISHSVRFLENRSGHPGGHFNVAELGQRVAVKLFEGGHSTHYSEEARKPLKAALDKFYDAPPYSGPAAKEASLN